MRIDIFSTTARDQGGERAKKALERVPPSTPDQRRPDVRVAVEHPIPIILPAGPPALRPKQPCPNRRSSRRRETSSVNHHHPPSHKPPTRGNTPRSTRKRAAGSSRRANRHHQHHQHHHQHHHHGGQKHSYSIQQVRTAFLPFLHATKPRTLHTYIFEREGAQK